MIGAGQSTARHLVGHPPGRRARVLAFYGDHRDGQTKRELNRPRRREDAVDGFDVDEWHGGPLLLASSRLPVVVGGHAIALDGERVAPARIDEALVRAAVPGCEKLGKPDVASDVRTVGSGKVGALSNGVAVAVSYVGATPH